MIDRRAFLSVLGAAIATPVLAQTPSVPLFNGRDLDGWTPVGAARWRVEDGLLTAAPGASGVLVSRESFQDFELRTEFWVSEDANSGIFIRCADRTRVNAGTAYEINIFDRRADPTYGTGAIVDVAPVSPMPRAGGRWNDMLIRAQGDRFDVILNGETTVDAARDSARAEGPIALQYGSGVVRFRRVELRVL